MKKISILLAVIFLLSNVPTTGLAADETPVLSSYFGSWKDGLPSGWSNSGNDSSAVSQDLEYHTRGSYGVRITDSSAGTTAGIKSSQFNVTPGKTYKLVAKGYVHEGNMTPFLRFTNSSGVAIDNTDIKQTVREVGRWNVVNVSGIAPEGAVKGQVWLHQHKNAISDVTWDDVCVYEYNFKAPTQGTPVNSKIIAPNGNTLKYNTYKDEDGTYERGNKLSDFSYAGYYAGEYEVPDIYSISDSVAVAEILQPSGDGNDTKNINDAIINAEAKLKSGELGENVKFAVVKLTAGDYYVERYTSNRYGAAIQLKSNIILAGEGQGPKGTVIHAMGKRPVKSNGDLDSYIVVLGYGGNLTLGNKTNISDEYVPSGSKTFNVDDASSFKVGDLIRIHHPSTEAWDKALGMSGLTYIDTKDGNKVKPHNWEGNVDMDTERTITKISGNTITVDFPLFVHLDNTIAQCTIIKLNDSKKLVNSGVENLRIVSDFDSSITDSSGRFVDENHANYGVYFLNAKDCYVQNVTFKHIMHSAVTCTSYSKRITIRGCSSIAPVSIVDGGRRYTFACAGNSQQILVNGCYSNDGRHDYETSFTATGPIAFVDNIADSSNAASETHGTWSTGVLYDNLYQIGNSTKAFIAATNRGFYGSTRSQGWSGAGVVIWNSLSPAIIANDVTLDYQNFLVGMWGKYDSETMKKTKINDYAPLYQYNNGTVLVDANGVATGIEGATIDINGKDSSQLADIKNLYFATDSNTSFVGDVYMEAKYTSVEPRSLYKAQISERFMGTFKKGKPNAPVIVSPMADEYTSGGAVNIQGIYQKGAEDVYVYVDNVRYTATLNESDNTFSAVISGLSAGTHKIYATQVIGGVEGNKTADRFIVMDNTLGAYNEYLSSVYTPEMLSVIGSDSRMTYNEYLDSLIVDELPSILDKVAEENVISGSLDGSDEITIKDQNGEEKTIGGRYVVLPGRVSQLRGYSVPKSNYGFLISDDGINYKEEKFASQLDLKGDAFGVCFYNLARVKTKYWFKQYVIYEDKNGEAHIVYSDPFVHEFK